MNLTNIILIVIVLGVAFAIVSKFIKKRKSEESDEKLQVDDRTYTLETMTEFVKKRLDEITKIKQRAINVNKDSQNIIQLLMDKEKIVPDAIKNICNFEQIQEKLESKQIIYIEKLDNDIKLQAEKYNWVYKEKNFVKTEIEIFFKEILKAQENKTKVYILAETKKKKKKYVHY